MCLHLLMQRPSDPISTSPTPAIPTTKPLNLDAIDLIARGYRYGYCYCCTCYVWPRMPQTGSTPPGGQNWPPTVIQAPILHKLPRHPVHSNCAGTLLQWLLPDLPHSSALKGVCISAWPVPSAAAHAPHVPAPAVLSSSTQQGQFKHSSAHFATVYQVCRLHILASWTHTASHTHTVTITAVGLQVLTPPASSSCPSSGRSTPCTIHTRALTSVVPTNTTHPRPTAAAACLCRQQDRAQTASWALLQPAAGLTAAGGEQLTATQPLALAALPHDGPMLRLCARPSRCEEPLPLPCLSWLLRWCSSSVAAVTRRPAAAAGSAAGLQGSGARGWPAELQPAPAPSTDPAPLL